MGVAGLWEVLRPAGQVRSLTELAVEEGFSANPSCQRGFRIGIDASIWFFHAAYGREGENPELRTLFFRCCRLLQSPLLPLFVFDGPNRPAIKRGKRVCGNAHWLMQGMKNIIDAFGFEWRVAPGEAEAELAYLNRVGVIDAVLSDDVDNFLFGATMVIRNPSNTLSGNRAHPVKNAQGKDDGNHVVIYTADAILSNPSVSLSHSGTILIGLLSGGDYIPAGLPGCGQKFATGLARAGFGDSLVKAIKELKGVRLDAFLVQWRQDIRNELKTNKSGLLPSKKPSLAASLPDDFPSLPVLMSYADPITSENASQKKQPSPVWRNDPDPMRIASLCELYFEWGVKDVIVHRFRTVLWPGIVCRAVRRAVIDGETCRRPPLDSAANERGDASEFFTLSSLVPLSSPSSNTPSCSAFPSSSTSAPSPLLLEVLSQRSHASTDSTLEYRVLVDPKMLVERTESGVKGLRPPLIGGLFGMDPEDENEENDTLVQNTDDDGSDGDAGIERLETAAGAASKSGVKKRKARREDPTTPLRLWLPACMIRAAAPALVEEYDEKVRVREEKKAKRGTKGTRGQRMGTSTKSTSRRTKVRCDAGDDDESVPGPSKPKTAAGWKAKGRTVEAGSGGRRKPKQASEAQDDAYEFIDLSAGESPYSSDGEDAEDNTRARGKAKARPEFTRPTAKVRTGLDATSRRGTTTNTMKEFFNTTKPSTARRTKSKPFISRPPAAKGPAAMTRVLEEEEDSTDVVAPPLPKSSRPLELLRAKYKPSLTSQPKSKSLATPRYEDEESSSDSLPTRTSGSKPKASRLPCQPIQPASKARKKPLFVDVSEDSDIEVIDVQRPLSGTAVATNRHKEVGGKVNDTDVSVGVGEPLPITIFEKTTGKVAVGVIGLKSKSAPSTSTTVGSLPAVRPVAGTIDPQYIARSPSKLDHIIPFQPTSESEGEEGSTGDGLPMFYHGSSKSRAKKEAGIVRPVPRPFPMQLLSETPASPTASRLEQRAGNRPDENDDVIEIVDVFTTPHGPSPPHSPPPSPSPVKPLPTHASRLSTSGRPRQSSGFSNRPTKSNIDLCQKTGQHLHASSDGDTPASWDEKKIVHKSPRKSAEHSSPRHVSHAHRRASSPTPLALSGSPHANNVSLWTGDMENYDASGGHGRIGDTDEWKPRLSDVSAIYISSGSEDEDAAGLDVNQSQDGRAAQTNDEYTDQDADTWADTGMILSAPPSPAPPGGDVPTLPEVGVLLPKPMRTSKFTPAPTSKVVMYPLSTEHQTSAKNVSTTSMDIGMTNHEDTDTIIPCPVRRAPLLIARARRSKGRDNDIIDLTSD